MTKKKQPRSVKADTNAKWTSTESYRTNYDQIFKKSETQTAQQTDPQTSGPQPTEGRADDAQSGGRIKVAEGFLFETFEIERQPQPDTYQRSVSGWLYVLFAQLAVSFGLAYLWSILF